MTNGLTRPKRCQYCGCDISWRAPQARSCSDRCKVLYSEAKRAGKADQVPAVTGSNVVPLHADVPKAPGPAASRRAAAAAPASPTVAAPAPPGLGSSAVHDATWKVLADANLVDTPLGRIALRLADRLDTSTLDTGSAMAAVAKQLESTLEKATASAPAQADPLDELRRLRDQKRRDAVG